MGRPVGSTNGRQPAHGYPAVSRELGLFLAGFLDGEACFGILNQSGGSHLRCVVTVAVRDDDAALIRWLAESTKLGSVRPVGARASAQPQIRWVVGAKADCLRLCELLDACPPRARKSVDYAIWRAAVRWWVGLSPEITRVGRDWSAMRYLKKRLQEAKIYDPDRVPEIIDRAPGLSAGWGDYLAGWVTAEGSFSIPVHGSGLRPTFQTRVRRDDLDVLQQLRSRTNCGRIYVERKSVPGRSPAAAWMVASRRDLRQIVEVFDEHPPRGRKAHEYNVWRNAASAYASKRPRASVLEELSGLRLQLAEVHRYRHAAHP